MDITTIRNRLFPQQVAVGVSGGAEAMVHAARIWISRSRRDPTVFLLQKDIKNLFNDIFHDFFLYEYRRYAPSSARIILNRII